MKESEFQGWIMDVAARYGWRCWHCPTPMRPVGQGRFVPDKRGAGLPDLFLMHADPPRLIFAEVKVDTPLSTGQREFLQLARGLRTALAQHFAATRYAIEEGCGGKLPGDWQNPFGVYTWRPGNEPLIEAILKGKVMVA